MSMFSAGTHGSEEEVRGLGAGVIGSCGLLSVGPGT